MAPIPTLQQLYNDILADLQTAFGGTIATFGKVFLRAIAAVQAAKLLLFYLALANVQKNIFIDTADPEAQGGTLERFGRVKLNREPFPAVAGQYTVQVTGTIGSTINALTTFKSDDTSTSPGKLYILDAAYTTIANPDTITLRALEAGLDARLLAGDTLTATSPIIGISSIATIATEAIQPKAAEDLEDYRQKALDAYRLEPQGGSACDYRLWSYDSQGVKQVYAYAKSGYANEINLYVEATTVDSTDGHGTPSAQLLLDVEAAVEFDPDTSKPINDRGRRPLGVFQVHYLPVTPLAVEVVIPNLSNRTTQLEADITAALTDGINLVRPFVPACDILDEKRDVLDTNYIIGIIQATAPGRSYGAIVLKVGGVQLSTYTFSMGNIPFVNSITFTP